MKIKFRVAVEYHRAGADAKSLLPQQFSTYDDANAFAETYRHECEPTIFVVVDNLYAFYCERSAVANEPYKVYSLKTTDYGQIETRIWWREFKKDPEKFLHLAIKINFPMPEIVINCEEDD